MTFPSPGISVPDAQLQQYLRTTAARGREVQRIGPFLATFDRHDDLKYLNYAIPDDGAQPTAADVAALVAAFERRGRLPRLEYLPSVAPDAEAVLVARGLAVEDRPPVMTCTPDSVTDLSPAAGLEIALPADDDDLAGMGAAQRAAFGQPPPHPASVARTRASIAGGAIAVLARNADTGVVVGGGIATTPSDATTEVAGIGVLAAYRRRGVAGAITARLAREAFAVGVTTAFLTPGDEEAHRVYERAGFADSSVMLHISRPEVS